MIKRALLGALAFLCLFAAHAPTASAQGMGSNVACNDTNGNPITGCGSSGKPISASLLGATTGSSTTFTDAAGNTVAAPQSLPDFRTISMPQEATWNTALANCQNQVVRLAALGDSRIKADSGQGNPNFGVDRLHRYFDLIQQYAVSIGCPSHGTGVIPIIASTNTNTPVPDGDWFTVSGGGSFTVDQGSTVGPYQQGTLGYGIAAVSAGTSINFNTGTVPYDHLALYCESAASDGTWNIIIDGNPVGTCGGSSSSTNVSLRALSSAVTLGPHTASIQCPSGGNACGAYAVEGIAGAVGVSVDNYGVGSAAAEWFGANPTRSFSFLDLVPEAPALVAVEFIANEPGIGYSTSSFTTAMTNIVQHVKAYSSNPSIILIAPMQDGIANQSTYYPIIGQVAAAQGVDFVDFRHRVGTAQVAGLYGPDTYHENVWGNAVEYSILWPKIFAIPFAPGALPTSNGSYPTNPTFTGATVNNTLASSVYNAQSTSSSASPTSTGLNVQNTGLDNFSIAGWGTGNNAGLTGAFGLYDNTNNYFNWNTNAAGDICFGTPLSGGAVTSCTGAPFIFKRSGSAIGVTIRGAVSLTNAASDSVSAPGLSTQAVCTYSFANNAPTATSVYYTIPSAGTFTINHTANTGNGNVVAFLCDRP